MNRNLLQTLLEEYVEHDLKRRQAVSKGDYRQARAKYRDMAETAHRASEAGIPEETLAAEAQRRMR